MAKKKEEKCNPMEMCMKRMGGGKGKCPGLFPLMPVIIGGILFALGWYLDPQTTRILWLAASGLIIFMGFMMFMMGTMMRR